jgi:hypothetical protein
MILSFDQDFKHFKGLGKDRSKQAQKSPTVKQSGLFGFNN